MFAQFVVLRMANQAGRGYLTEERQAYVYLFTQVVAIAGFLSHAAAYGALKNKKPAAYLTAGALGLFFFGANAMLWFSPASRFYMFATGLTVFLTGFVGGAVYLRLAFLFRVVPRPGLSLGAGYAAAVALQYFLQLRRFIPAALTVLLLPAFAVIAISLLSPDDGSPKHVTDGERVPARKIVFASVVTVALLIFTSYYNTYIHHLQVASGYTTFNAYSAPRLLMIPLVILFGFIGDFRGGRFLGPATLCVTVIALLNAVLVGSEAYTLNMCLFYVALSAVVVCYHMSFLPIALRTRRPALWAPFGRVLDSVVVGLSFLLGLSDLSQVAVLAIDIAALAAAIIAMAANGDLSPGAPEQPKAPAAGPEKPAASEAASIPETLPDAEPESPGIVPDADPFETVSEKYGLTPAELRVFRELVLTEDKQAAIAENLSIKLRTVQANVTSIYKKTGVSTRAGLVQIYRGV